MKAEANKDAFQKCQNHLRFSDLPPSVRERLRNKINGGGETIVIKTANIMSSYLIIGAAVLWLLTLFYFADDFLWSNAKSIILGLISLIAAYFLIVHTKKLARWLKTNVGGHLLITPHYVVDINFNDVCFWNLEQLNSINHKHVYQNGVYRRTEVELFFENAARKFTFDDREIAEEKIEKIGYWRKLFIEARARRDSDYINSNDDFSDLKAQDYKDENKFNSPMLIQLTNIGATVILTAGIMFAAFSLNDYFDDKKSCNNARTTGSASSYRKYIQTHRQGRWLAEARTDLQEIYEQAEQKYQNSLNADYDQNAFNAVVQILRYAKETQNYRVKVSFERHNEISPNIVEELKKDQEVKNLLPLDDSFSDEKMKQREANLLVRIASAFGTVIPNDVLEITNECPDECSLFLVKYAIDSDAVYFDTRQEKLPEAERIYYPGIYIDWHFDVQTPNQPQAFSFELTSDPASQISYDSATDEESESAEKFQKILEKDLANIYNSMASSAFDDFQSNLIYRMGIGEKPKPKIEPSPATAAKEKTTDKDQIQSFTLKSKESLPL